MVEPITEGWIDTGEAQALSGYSGTYLRRLCNRGDVEARKVGRDWLIWRESLLAYRDRMDSLGREKHNPLRDGLARQGRGRNKSTNQPTDQPQEATDERRTRRRIQRRQGHQW